MDVTPYFSDYTADPDKLCQFGFCRKDGEYVYKSPIVGEDFYAVLCVSGSSCKLQVFDSVFSEEYAPFNVQSATGATVGAIRQETDKLLVKVKENCFVPCDTTKKVMAYIREKYGAAPDYPWQDEHCVFRLANGKWFALIMIIPAEKLGLRAKGLCTVINLKNEPENIPMLIDRKNVFVCYHMNKKHWISVLVDNTIEFGRLCSLIDQSYQLTLCGKAARQSGGRK